MTNEEVYESLKGGNNRFLAKRSKRVYFVHIDQMAILTPFTDDVLIVGWPETLSPAMKMRRYRGRKWVWLSPKNIEIAP